MPDDWFRSPDWDAAARDDFERRLARARTYNRPQYLKIKAIALREAGQTDASRGLLDRALDDPNIYDFEAAYVTELLGDLSGEVGERDEAEQRYRHVLTTWPTLNGTSGSVEISLAEVLAEKQGSDATGRGTAPAGDVARETEAAVRRRSLPLACDAHTPQPTDRRRGDGEARRNNGPHACLARPATAASQDGRSRVDGPSHVGLAT